jgi:DNA-binding MarR family transcriptional regulator
MAQPLQPDDLDALSHRLRRVLRASHEADLALARRMELGLNDVAALDLLALEGPQGAAQIARRLGMRPASATVLVDRLEAAGHVERTRDDADRRRVTVAPTMQAYRDALAAMAPLLQALEAAVADLDAAERAVVDRYLTRVAEALQAYVEATPY